MKGVVFAIAGRATLRALVVRGASAPLCRALIAESALKEARAWARRVSDGGA